VLHKLNGVPALTKEEKHNLYRFRNKYANVLKMKEEREAANNEEEEIKVIEEPEEERSHKVIKTDSDTTSSSDDSDSVGELPKPKPRAERKPRKSISAEAFGKWNRKEDFVPPVIPKTDAQKERIRSKLTSFLFNGLEPKEIEIVICAMTELRAAAGDKVIIEGNEGDCLYVVEEGELDCTKLFPGNTEVTFFKTYVAGEAFGELALLYNAMRAASITAKTECILWSLDRRTFNHIVKDSAIRRRTMYETFLKKVSLLS